MSRAVHDVEYIQKKSLLLPEYSAAANARPTIAHVQLRDLLSCPLRRGVVYYATDRSIVERDLLNPDAPPRIIVELNFTPKCLTATAVASSRTQILFAAGGKRSHIHLSLHSFPPAQPTNTYMPPRLMWRHFSDQYILANHILFTPAALTDDKRSGASSDMCIVVSGNDMLVKFFDVALAAHVPDDARMRPCGAIRLEMCVNHVSISPNGRTLLCVGDTPKAYLFHISPGPSFTFVPVATYTLPPPPHTAVPVIYPTLRSLACFATAWSTDALKFAIASEEQLCVWDVRSAEPLYTSWTPFRWDREDLSVDDGVTRFEYWLDHFPDSGIRNIRFSMDEEGRELLVWAEHTTNIHVIDARTFDPASHAVVPFPDLSHLVPAPEPEPYPPTAVGVMDNAMRSVEITPRATDEQETAHAVAEAVAGTPIEHTKNTATSSLVNIAGICFDSSGGWLYVAGEQGIVE